MRPSCCVTLATCLLLLALGCSIDSQSEPGGYAWESRSSARHEILFPAEQSLVTSSRQTFTLDLFNGAPSDYEIHWRVSAGGIIGPADQSVLVWQTPASGPAWIGVELTRGGESWICCRPVSFADQEIEIRLFLHDDEQTDGMIRVDFQVSTPSIWSLQMTWGCSSGSIVTEGFDHVLWNLEAPGPQSIWCRVSNGRFSDSDTLTTSAPSPQSVSLTHGAYQIDGSLSSGSTSLEAHLSPAPIVPWVLTWGCSAGEIQTESDSRHASWTVMAKGPQRAWCRLDTEYLSDADTLAVVIPNIPPAFDVMTYAVDPPTCAGAFDMFIYANDANQDTLTLDVDCPGFELLANHGGPGPLGFTARFSVSLQPTNPVTGTFPITFRLSDGEDETVTDFQVTLQCP